MKPDPTPLAGMENGSTPLTEMELVIVTTAGLASDAMASMTVLASRDTAPGAPGPAVRDAVGVPDPRGTGLGITADDVRGGRSASATPPDARSPERSAAAIVTTTSPRPGPCR
jgi:hypothetical protein